MVMNDSNTFTIKGSNFKNTVNFILISRGTKGKIIVENSTVDVGAGALSITGLEGQEADVEVTNVKVTKVQYVIYSFNFVKLKMTDCWTVDIGFIDQIAPIVFYRSTATITGGGVEDSTSTVDASVNAV